MKNTATKIINVEQAELKTATVEISHITVNARKLTLSVFRQIQEEDIIVGSDGKYSLAGVPWGLVNYFWNDMGTPAPRPPYGSGADIREHGQPLHVLWQKGKELRRALVKKVRPISETGATGMYITQWAGDESDPHKRLLKDASGDDLRDATLVCLQGTHDGAVVLVDAGCVGWRTLWSFEKRHPITVPIPEKKTVRPPDWLAELERSATIKAEIVTEADELEEAVRPGWNAKARELLAEETANRAAFNAQVDALAALPQLFVAV